MHVHPPLSGLLAELVCASHCPEKSWSLAEALPNGSFGEGILLGSNDQNQSCHVTGIFGASGSAPAFGGGDAPVFGSVAKAPASEQGSGLKSGTPAFGLGNGPASGSGFSFGASSGASLGAQSSPAFGTGAASATAPSAGAAPSTSGFTFGGSAPLAFGAGSAAAAGAASAAAPAFGAPQQTAGLHLLNAQDSPVLRGSVGPMCDGKVGWLAQNGFVMSQAGPLVYLSADPFLLQGPCLGQVLQQLHSSQPGTLPLAHLSLPLSLHQPQPLERRPQALVRAPHQRLGPPQRLGDPQALRQPLGPCQPLERSPRRRSVHSQRRPLELSQRRPSEELLQLPLPQALPLEVLLNSSQGS